jgi:hypothetical protein
LGDAAFGDAAFGEADLALPRETVFINGVYLHKCGGSLQLGDRRVALHSQVRTNSLANGFG